MRCDAKASVGVFFFSDVRRDVCPLSVPHCSPKNLELPWNRRLSILVVQYLWAEPSDVGPPLSFSWTWEAG